MKGTVIAALFALAISVVVPVQAQSPVAGKDYTEIPNGRPLDPPAAGTIVVEEFFNYICPACNAFEPTFVAWQAKLPADVKVVHIPATFRADFMQYAKAYYAAEALGLVDKTHRCTVIGPETIGPGGSLLVPLDGAGAQLGNNGGNLVLLDPGGRVVDAVAYPATDAVEGRYVRFHR